MHASYFIVLAVIDALILGAFALHPGLGIVVALLGYGAAEGLRPGQ